MIGVQTTSAGLRDPAHQQAATRTLQPRTCGDARHRAGGIKHIPAAGQGCALEGTLLVCTLWDEATAVQ